MDQVGYRWIEHLAQGTSQMSLSTNFRIFSMVHFINFGVSAFAATQLFCLSLFVCIVEIFYGTLPLGLAFSFSCKETSGALCGRGPLVGLLFGAGRKPRAPTAVEEGSRVWDFDI